MESGIARFLAVALGLAGLLCFCAYPLARYRHRRNESDIARAQVPLLMQSLNANQVGSRSRFDVQIPSDDQWRRIVERLGQPQFAVTLLIDGPRGTTPTVVTVAELMHLVAVQRNGVDVPAVAKTTHLESALVPISVDALEFAAAPGDRVRIDVRSDRLATEGERLVLMPEWTKSSVLSWGEGAAADMFIGQVGGLLLGVVGALAMWGALIVAWGRPS